MSCAKCQTPQSHFQCENCRTVYCGAKCQQSDWIDHQQGCELVGQLIALIEGKNRPPLPKAMRQAFVFLIKHQATLDVVVGLLAASDELLEFAKESATVRQLFGGVVHIGHAILLYEISPNPKDFVNQLFLHAVEKGLVNLVGRLLADSRVDPAADNNLAVVYATHYGHDDVVKLLLADPRIKN